MGGSLAIFQKGELSASISGDGHASRAEDLLVSIDRLCKETFGGVDAVEEIVVSLGPGSFTGLRIGIATVLGIARAIGARASGADLLQAMATLAPDDGHVIAAIPIGRSDVCLAEFRRQAVVSEPIAISRDDAVAHIAASAALTVIHHPSLADLAKDRHAIDAGADLARLLPRAASLSPHLQPIYVQNQRFANA